MDSGIATAPEVGGNLPPVTWERVAERLGRYLHALGIRDPLQSERLIARIRQRWDVRINAAPLEDKIEAAIEEACALLDIWLTAELGIAGDQAALFSARAAVLSGAVPNWGARFAGISGESIAAQIHAASVQPVPELAPLAMEPSTINLLGHGVRSRIATAFRVLIGSHPVAVSGTDTRQLGQPR